MKHVDLTCVIFPDVTPWERLPVESMISHIGGQFRTQVLVADKRWAVDWGKAQDSRLLWCLARDWKLAFDLMRRIEVERSFVSVFGMGRSRAPMSTLFLRRLRPVLGKNAHIITHSPINYRFFREIEGIQNKQVSFLHLPLVSQPSSSIPEDRPFRVGTLGHFNREGNFNYLMTAAHYVHRTDPDVRFKIYGQGGLESHITKMAQEMGLSKMIEIDNTEGLVDFSDIDVLVYAPLRNHHFIPVSFAASKSIPVLASEVPGISDYIQDGKNGYVIPIHETKPLGELILRLKREEAFRAGLGRALNESLREKLSLTNVSDEYLQLFFGKVGKASTEAA